MTVGPSHFISNDVLGTSGSSRIKLSYGGQLSKRDALICVHLFRFLEKWSYRPFYLTFFDEISKKCCLVVMKNKCLFQHEAKPNFVKCEFCEF